MKTKIKHLSRKTISVILAIVMILSCMAVGIISVDAWTASAKGKIYFAMPYTWTSNINTVQYCIVKSDSTKVQPKVTLNEIANTDLYYGAGDWDDATYEDDFNRAEIIANSSGWGNFDSWNNASLSHYTNPVEYKCTDENQYYKFYYSSTEAKGISVTTGNSDSRDYALNVTQKVYAYTALTTGGSYSNDESGGKVVVSYKTLSNDNTASDQSFDTDTADGNEYYTVPAQLTLTATANAGYKFDGWFTSDSGGTALSTNSSEGRTVSSNVLSYHAITQNYAIYARFSPTGKTVNATALTRTFNLDTGLLNAPTASTTGGTVTPTTAVIASGNSQTYSVSATSGYTFKGWYTDELAQTEVEPVAGKIAINASTHALTITDPAANANYYALFEQNEPQRISIVVGDPSEGTVKATWNGVTKSNGGTLTNIPVGATVTLSATATNQLTHKLNYFTKDGTSLGSKVSSFVAAAGDNGKTVSAVFQTRTAYTVKATTNDSSLGTVTVNDAYSTVAEAGEIVNVTLARTASNASLKSIKVYEDGDATNTVTPSGSGMSYTFEMPAHNTRVAVEWEVHSEPASLYYDGYNTSHVKDNDYDTKQFTEAKYNDQTYAYYHVQRTGANQVFTVKTSPGAAASSGGKYFYLKAVKTGDLSNTNGSVYMYCFDSQNTQLLRVQMSYDTDIDSCRTYHSPSPVPKGTTKIGFEFDLTSSTKWSQDITGEYLSEGAAYVTSENVPQTIGQTGSGSNLKVAKWSNCSNQVAAEKLAAYPKYDGTFPDEGDGGKLYLWGDDVYKNGASYGFNMTLSQHTGTLNYANTTANISDYYIIALYENTDYSKLYPEADSAPGSSNKIRFYAASMLPGNVNPIINYYAKDGVVRMYNLTTASFAETTVTSNGYVTAGTSKDFTSKSTEAWVTNEKWLEGTATKGQSITVTTTIDPDLKCADGTTPFKDKYYVKGFSFNGVTPELLTWRSDGVYTSTYNIPANMVGDKLEITPIFFKKDDANTVTFYIDGYNETVQSAWGSTLYVYPFYQYYKNGSSGDKTTYEGQAENFRGYPGQPVINYGGQRYIQIPLTDDGTAGGYRVKGVTLSNGFWDQVHGKTNASTGSGYDSSDTMGADVVSSHYQTYDFDDFYKIYNEYKLKGDKNLNSIYFTFKYKTGDNHRTTYKDSAQNSNTASLYYKDDVSDSLNVGNYSGWEYLTDVYGRKVDLFGDVLSDAAVATYKEQEMRVVSEGYENNNAGAYATEWAVFHYNNGSYRKVTSDKTMIVPSTLAIASATDVSETAYPALDGDKATAGYKNIYQALEAYRGIPVLISYESDIHGGAKPTNTYDPANRSDGRWSFTRTNDYITGNVKIEYINEKTGVTEYTEDEFIEGTNQGTITGAKAYFTYQNADKNGYSATEDGKTEITALVQNDKFFTFEAEAGSYEFTGWYYVDSNGDYHPVNNNDLLSLTGESGMSSSATFVARFKFVANGSLTISHNLLATSKGTGTTYIGVSVDGKVIADVNTNTKSVTLDSKYIGTSGAKAGQTVTITLKTDPSGESYFDSSNSYGNVITAAKQDSESNTSTIASGTTFFGGSNAYTAPAITRTISFTVSDLFENAEQITTALNYYSELKLPTNNYKVKYTYLDRYGNQKAYTVTGEFTQAELKAYTNYPTGTGTNKTFSSTKFFIDKTPEESNFNKLIEWNTDDLNDIATSGTDTNIGNLGWNDLGNNVYEYRAVVTSTSTDNLARHAIFELPYAVVTSGDDINTPIISGDKVAYITDSADYSKPSINTVYGKWFDRKTTLTSSSTVDGVKFVTAPVMCYDRSTPMYFKQWGMYSLTAEGKPGKLVRTTYYPEFNYVAYENYYIKAVYSANPDEAYSSIASTNNNKPLEATVSFLQDSRNQWNNSNNGGNPNYVAGDLIYNDFALAYRYNGEVLNDYTDKNVRVGLVIEKLNEVDMSGGKHIGTLDSYEKKYAGSVATSISQIKTALESNPSATITTTAGTSVRNVKIADNYKGGSSYQLSNTTFMDNKNRTEYGYSIYNTWNDDDSKPYDIGATYSNKNYVYRAFAYIAVKDGDTWNVAVSESPAYFCMYDTAVK